MSFVIKDMPRCDAKLLTRVRETAPRKHDVFKMGDVSYVARRVDTGVVIRPSKFMACTYQVSGDDGSDCVAEFIHIENQQK